MEVRSGMTEKKGVAIPPQSTPEEIKNPNIAKKSGKSPSEESPRFK